MTIPPPWTLMKSEAGPDLDNIREALEGLRDVAVQTPLLELPGFSHPVQLKAEFQQPIHAFKIRGAWTAIRRLPQQQRIRGVVTTSSGNHGLGIAWAARQVGIPALIVMPGSASPVKIAGIRALGAEVLLAGESRGIEQDQAAAALTESRGMTLIPPFNHPDVIAGQATCALEILEQWPELTTLVVPVGGGGLLAGSCCAVRALGRPIELIAVEPAGIPKLSAAIRNDAPIPVEGGSSIADGLLTRSIGALTWPLIRGTVNKVAGVTDNEILKAMHWLAASDIRVEPSGAATMAALLSDKIQLSGPTALIATGGNVDPSLWESEFSR